MRGPDEVPGAPSPVPASDADAGAAAREFEADLDRLARERDELLDVSRRLQADFENYRKRVLREQTALVERATEGLVEQLLPVLDAFEAAIATLGSDPGTDPGSNDDDIERIRKGVELVHAELLGVLAKHGLETVAATGVGFDPNEHEAVLQEPGDGEPVVADVLRTGWKLKGRVLRPAMVKVTHVAQESAG
jgi:molecular chaperone GrpE